MSNNNKGQRPISIKDQLEIAVASDAAKNCIIINFGEKVQWIAMHRETAEQLRDMLTTKILELPTPN